MESEAPARGLSWRQKFGSHWYVRRGDMDEMPQTEWIQ